MKKIFLSLLFVNITFYTIELQAQNQSGGGGPLKIAYTIPENDVVPEGIAYDPATNSFFVSSTYKRKIIKVNSKGKAIDFTEEQQDGLLGVVGMRVDARKRILWAASGDVGSGMPIKNSDSTQIGFTGLYKYDLKSGKLIKKYLLHIPGENHFLNDLTLDSLGKPYITDTRNHTIYTINNTNDELEIFLDLTDKYYPNGIDITPDNKYLYVAMYSSPHAAIGRIEIATKKVDLVNLNNQSMSGADGLYFYNNSLIAVIPNQPKDTLSQYFLDKSGTSVTNSFIHVNGDKLLSQPSTGVLVGDKLYFVATSNLQLFRKLYAERKENVNINELAPIRIGVINLKTNGQKHSK